MIVTSSKAFREEVLRQLHFQPSDRGHCTLFRDLSAPENGYFLFYSNGTGADRSESGYCGANCILDAL